MSLTEKIRAGRAARRDGTDYTAAFDGVCEDARKKPSTRKPFKPFEVNDDAVSGRSNPSTFLRQSDENPSTEASPKDTGPGQNQIAALVVDKLDHLFAWDDTAGSWFERRDIESPFRECSSVRMWRAVRDECGKHREKFAAGFVNGVETFCRADLHVDSWSADPNELPMENGVLNLHTGKLREYEWRDRFNWRVPYPFDGRAECPLIDSVLDRMVGGEADLLEFLLCWLACVLRGRYDVQAFLELVGEGGTGKSTFLRIATMLVGDENVASTDLASLEGNRFETAGLYGKRLALVTDSARFRGDVPVLKAITGGDPIRLERKNVQQRRPYVFDGLVAIAANQPLESSDYSTGLSRRRRSIIIDYVVATEERKRFGDKKLFPNGFEGALRDEMPGLLNRLLALDIDACANVVSDPTAGVARQRLMTEVDTNPMLSWAEDWLVTCRDGSETQVGNKGDDPTRLYPNYSQYCEQIGQHPVSLVRFGRDLPPLLIANGIDTEKTRVKATILRRLRLRRNPVDDGVRTLLLARNPATNERVAGSAEGSDEGLIQTSVGFERFEGSNSPGISSDAEATGR